MSTSFNRLRSGTRRRRRILFLLPMAILAFTGGAYAYFTSGGSSTTTAPAVGTASNLNVSFGAATGTMYPGAGTATVPVTVTNPGGGSQALSGINATVNSDSSGYITSNGSSVTGCMQSWFTASLTAPSAPVTLAPSGTWSSTVSVTMANANVNQNVCQGKTPDLTVTAS